VTLTSLHNQVMRMISLRTTKDITWHTPKMERMRMESMRMCQARAAAGPVSIRCLTETTKTTIRIYIPRAEPLILIRDLNLILWIMNMKM